MKEVRGLCLPLPSNNDHHPADMLVPSSATELHWSFDVTIIDPTNKTILVRLSDRQVLAAAPRAHNKKLEMFRMQLELAGPTELQFEKRSLGFETTGAMGKVTQAWWKEATKLATERQRHHVQER